jgi:hypothetical protein
MSRRVRWLIGGSVILVTLAGCGRSFLQYAERAPWRREAELACLNSGTVREGPGVVKISPVEGAGVCGMDFPLKISELGESQALGYFDESMRPPASIPGAGRSAGPRWPVSQPSYPPPAGTGAPVSAPMSLEAPGVSSQPYPPQQLGAPPANLQAPADWQRVDGRANVEHAHGAPEIEQSPLAEPPRYGQPSAPSTVPARSSQERPFQERPLPSLGPARNPRIAASTPVELKPSATLACPIVSALDRWIADSVQPAARKWFGQPVVEIKQISAYSCRGMNGQPGAHISEHAFGNALDIAAFVLADGHRITVQGGWKGAPEEQGFLRDVQGAACDQFTTVLAPGSNRFHYNHIHVDLMRRASGRRICQPGAVDGEVVAARARKGSVFASRPISPPPTRRYDPPVSSANDPFAWRGDVRRGEPATTGSIARQSAARDLSREDNDWVEDPGPRPAIKWSNEDRFKAY